MSLARRLAPICASILFFSLSARAGRPLFTDDAGVVGRGRGQLETWLWADERSAQHWISPAWGVLDTLEISLSGVYGVDYSDRGGFSVTGLIPQGKLLLQEPAAQGRLGWALAGGLLPPVGRGFLSAPEWESYGYLIATRVFAEEQVLLHLNAGAQSRRQLKDRPVVIWGAAVELKTGEGTYAFAELASGDPYATVPGVAAQLGLRHEVSDRLQLDGSAGTGFTGDPRLPAWLTLGIRVLTSPP